MAMRGQFLGVGFVTGIGQGRIFQDLDDTKSLFFIKNGSGQEFYLARSRVRFRKTKKAN
jgi:hypothetical protein